MKERLNKNTFLSRAKDGSDKAAIEAGKLLVKEILYNTIDNTNNLI